MTKEGAETAVTTSALIVAGIYTYRKLTENNEPVIESHSPGAVVKGMLGTKQLLPVGVWVTGAGVTFIFLSILAAASPDIGGNAAILVATTTTLGNGTQIFKDLKGRLQQGSAAPEPKSSQELAEKISKERGVPLFKSLSNNHPPIYPKVVKV